MSKSQYEVEVKTLLGAEESAQKLRDQIQERGDAQLTRESYNQLNHYFEGGDVQKLVEALSPKLATDDAAQMAHIATGEKISVRTREMESRAFIVLKASLGSDTSQNGVIRLELEAIVPGTTLDELDAVVLSAGYAYQAKWSRTREEYILGPVTICLDKNAGYGYLAEFERVVDDSSKANEVKDSLLALMQEFNLEELPQDRLERMFAHYNAHWDEFYGTDNIFTLD